MRIGFDAFPAVQSYGGVGNYTSSLLNALHQFSPEVEIYAYIPHGFLDVAREKHREVFDSIQWKEVTLWAYRKQGRIDQLDLFHGTNFKCQTIGRCGSVLTIHDLWLDRHPEYSKKLFGQRFSYYRTRQRVHQCSRVIAVSSFTSLEVQELYEISEEKISVIPHGISENFFPDHDEEKFNKLREAIGLPVCPFILFLGGANPRKNHQALLRAFAKDSFLRENYVVVVVGSKNFKSSSIADTILDAKLSGKVVSVEQVSSSDLRVLYSKAALFVFPSRYEGFGFPVLEAMACGAPVITSNYSALPEVAGDAALLVDPGNIDALAASMVQVLQDSNLRVQLQKRGRERVAQCTWELAAQKTIEVYQEVYDRGLQEQIND